jgi:hypothetical protein
MMNVVQRLVPGIALLAGCSSDQDDLTCALLADPSNCFDQAAAALAACMPMRATPATLSADKMTCTFADGVYVLFNHPVPSFFMYPFNGSAFDVYGPDASLCGHVAWSDNTGQSIGIVVGGMSAGFSSDEQVRGSEFSCPTHTYRASFDALGGCKDHEPYLAGLGPAPYGFTIGNVSTTSSPLFVCE